jgi:hypothetical protein
MTGNLQIGPVARLELPMSTLKVDGMSGEVYFRLFSALTGC